MPLSPEFTGLNSSWMRGQKLTRQVAGLMQTCRVELIALVAAVSLTAILGRGLLLSMQDWDANGVVLVIGALWMAICVLLYSLLGRNAR